MTTSNTTTRKPTKRDRYNALLAIPAVAADADLVEFINHEIDLLNRKNMTKDGEKKLTKTQTENAKVAEEILSYMEIDHLYAPADLIKLVPACAEYSVPKVSAVVRPLVDDNKIVKVNDKRKVYYKLA